MGDVIDLEAKRKERAPRPRPLTPQQQAIIANAEAIMTIARHVEKLVGRIDRIERELKELLDAARR